MDLGDSVYHIERGVLDLHELLEHAEGDELASITDHDYYRLSRLFRRLNNCLSMIEAVLGHQQES